MFSNGLRTLLKIDFFYFQVVAMTSVKARFQTTGVVKQLDKVIGKILQSQILL